MEQLSQADLFTILHIETFTPGNKQAPCVAQASQASPTANGNQEEKKLFVLASPPESPVTGITGVGFGGWVWSPVKPPAALPAILSRRLVRLMVKTPASAPGTLLNIVNRIRTAPWRGLDRPPAV